MKLNTEGFNKEAYKALQDKVLQKAIFGMQERLGKGTAQAYQKLPEGPELRLVGHRIRKKAIENLDVLLESLARKIRGRGGHVIFAEDDRAAVDACLKIARNHGVEKIVKGKSMVTEEIRLNETLEANGLEVTETDLGEYIIQLAGETPSHIIAPAIHRTRDQIGALFSEKLGIPLTSDPPTLTHAARKALRKKFLSADMGISGCNLSCAESGHMTTVSNEGNIRMATTLPRIHVAFMGMERIVAGLKEHDVMFRLLSRGAAAQNMAGYVSYIGGPRQNGQSDGPDQFYLIVIDNGRSKILADVEMREILYCIRCAACLNVCPVYGKIGGHAYGSPYSGPVGAVITPLLFGVKRSRHLCQGTTLCGACQEACPVNINLPRLLLALRQKLAEGDPYWDEKPSEFWGKQIFKTWAWLVQRPRLYDIVMQAMAWGQKPFTRDDGLIHHFPYPFHGWTRGRNIRPISTERFVKNWNKRR